jgi:hypothetical protein
VISEDIDKKIIGLYGLGLSYADRYSKANLSGHHQCHYQVQGQMFGWPIVRSELNNFFKDRLLKNDTLN